MIIHQSVVAFNTPHPHFRQDYLYCIARLLLCINDSFQFVRMALPASMLVIQHTSKR